MWKYLCCLLFVPCFLTYIIQHIIVAFFYKTQNLKKRYKADWALVTGASSGACVQFALTRVRTASPAGFTVQQTNRYGSGLLRHVQA